MDCYSSHQKIARRIFKKGSKTYYGSSLFFPKKTKAEVTTLYAFVRIFDDLVDAIPQDRKGFYQLKEYYQKKLNNLTYQQSDLDCTVILIVDKFIEQVKRLNFNPAWVDSFLWAMEQDLTKSRYEDWNDLLKYIHGSAEVIGLMMSRIMNLPDESLPAAMMLGRSMQYINFIRDIQEDLSLNRCYIPITDLKRFGFANLNHQTALENPKQFQDLIADAIVRYQDIRNQAKSGFKYIPKSIAVPIMMADHLYASTAKRIQKNPLVVFECKVKPSKLEIFLCFWYHLLKPHPRASVLNGG